MKKFLFIALLLICSGASAEGIYDGIWHVPNVGYFSVHENGGVIIAIRLTEDTKQWEAFSGRLSDNSIRMETLISGVEAVINITWASATEFSATQESCIPAPDPCLLPNNFTFHGSKVW